ncbi:MAG: hypothetical protein AAB973_01850 [Patescibacteria group bacterium]
MAKNLTHLKHRPFFRPLLNWLSHHWLLFVLVAFSLGLSFLNYQPGTILTGWDNLHPEYNFSVNIKRSLFAVWQEYQSLGLLGGMAHAADLPRILILGILRSLGVGGPYLRYFWTFLMLTIGPIGVYVFLNRFFLKHKFDAKTIHFASFLGGLFYLLNLSTLQHFFTPFEAFTAFYGFFPWLIVSLYFFLEKPSPPRFLLLFLTNLIASPSFYTETLFVVYGLCVIVILADNISSALASLTAIGLANAYWLLPVIFFVATRGGVGLAAKINIIATPETYYRNLAFGNLANLALLRGFWFDFLDLAGGNRFDFLLLTWKNHLANPVTLIIGFLAFALVVTGAVYSFSKKLPARRSILGITLLCLFFLMGGGLLINQSLPLIGELFRSPFTKFSTVLSFGYAAFFAIGAIFVLDLFSFLHSRLTYYLTLFTVTLALVIFMTPAFTGGLISPTMRLKLPAEYGQLFDFFKNQDPATRIANFPQYTFWGWNYYSWGYRGSGFLWYGIRQPILDRAFDVWERSGEKYYQEISTALFSEDRAEFERLIDKYAVNWILLDKNVISPNANQDLGNEKLLAILTTSPKFSLAENINNKILIYKTDIDRKVKNFLSTSGPAEPLSQPFADLSLRPLALHSLGEGGFAQITNDTVTLTAKGEGALYLPSYTQTENLIPTTVAYRKTPTGLQLKFTPRLPEIKVDRKIVSPTATPIFLDFALPENSSGLILGLNDQYLEVQLPDELSIQSSFYPLTNLYLPSRETSRVSLYANVPAYKLDLTTPLSGATLAQCYTDKPNRKIEKIVAAKTISLFGTDLVGCLSAPIPMAGVDQLISLEFTYHSATGTPANANITNATYGGTNSPQPLLAKKSPTFTRLFAKPLQGQALQANLILEANESKSTQEVIYQNVSVSYLPLLGETGFIPNPIPPMQVPNLQARQVRNLSISIPLLDTPYTVAATAENLNSEARNCDNFNQGDFSRSITADGFLYSAKNANSCDQLNLKHLAHQTNYAIIIDAQNQRGLFPTVCLENHATRRCDVFERLVNGQQIILQPIANSNELPGYTLHLFNQSFGNRPTENLIKSISVVPFPLSFLKKISFSSASDSSGVAGTDSREVARITNSTHPAEFLYTANISWDGGRSEAKDSSQVISLYQTYSPYWKALLVSEEDLKLPTWLLIAKLPFLYLNKPVILANAGIYTEWYNSWELPAGENRLVIFYLPQYLEFLGFLLLLTPFLAVPVYILFIRKKAPPKK